MDKQTTKLQGERFSPNTYDEIYLSEESSESYEEARNLKGFIAAESKWSKLLTGEK